MYKDELKKELEANLILSPANSIYSDCIDSENEKLNKISKQHLYLLLNELQDEGFLNVSFNRNLHPKRFPIKVYSLTIKNQKK